MPAFNGFPDGKLRLTALPGPFFSDLLPEIDHLGELKVTLYAFWRVSQMEGEFRLLRREDFIEDAHFMAGLAKTEHAQFLALDEALERAALRGSLLAASLEQAGETETVYLLNTPRGRAAVEAIRQGRWRADSTTQAAITLNHERPNIFRLYEQNIGPLTPLLADTLREAEENYPAVWIGDAFKIAVERNARNWKYIEAILRSWKEKGRDEPDRRDLEKNRRRYDEGEFADFIDN
jgi:DnaD/phage-associated family protein